MAIAEDGAIEVGAGFVTDNVPLVSPTQLAGLGAAATAAEDNLWAVGTGDPVTTSTAFTNKVTLACPARMGGTYKLEVSYGWSLDVQTSDFVSRLEMDGAPITSRSNGEEHRQEPKDSAGASVDGTGTNQAHGFHRIHIITLPVDATPTFTLDWASGVDGAEAGIWESILVLSRLGA